MGAAPPTADSPLGELVQRLLPGPLFFLPALLYPTITVAAALAAAHTTAAVQAVAALPAVQVGLGPGRRRLPATEGSWPDREGGFPSIRSLHMPACSATVPPRAST